MSLEMIQFSIGPATFQQIRGSSPMGSPALCLMVVALSKFLGFLLEFETFALRYSPPRDFNQVMAPFSASPISVQLSRRPNSSGASLPCIVCAEMLTSKTKIWSPPPNRYADTYTSAPYGKIWFFFTVVCVSTSPFPHCAQLMIIIPFRYMPQFNPNVFTILSRVVFHGFGLLNASS